MNAGALAARHLRNNAATAGHHALYTEHRRRLLQLVRQVRGGARGGRVCVLGAGNANDLALGALASDFDAVHLVDLDAAALGQAVRAQPPATRARLVVHAPVDASGLLPSLAEWQTRTPPLAELAAAASAAPERVARELPGPFDLVLSDCLLTQIFWSCYEALGQGPLLGGLVQAALAAHLRTLAALARPGGACVLVTDAVSSDTVPLDPKLGARDASTLLAALDRRGALFTGTGPTLVQRTLACTAPHLAAGARVSPPWPWRMDAQRTALVYGFSFTVGAADCDSKESSENAPTVGLTVSHRNVGSAA